MSELQLGFHGFFPLQKSELLKILNAVSEKPGIDNSVETLQNRTSLSQAKINAMLRWANQLGILKADQLTKVGRLVLKKDPYLESIVTDWFLHFSLSFGASEQSYPPSFPSDWGGITYLIYDFLPTHQKFSIDELCQQSTVHFPDESLEQLASHFQIVLDTYIKELSSCNLFSQNGSGFFNREKPDFSKPFSPYIVGYMMAKFWEKAFGNTAATLTNELLQQPLQFINAFGLSDEDFMAMLEQLEAEEIIELQSATPYVLGTNRPSPKYSEQSQIIRLWESPLVLLEEAYKRDRSTPNQPLINVLDDIWDDDDNELPIFSIAQDYFSRLCPQQPQPIFKPTPFQPFSHLAV